VTENISTSIFSTDWVQKRAESDWEHFHQHFQYRLSTEKSWEWPRTFPPASSVETEYRKELRLGVTENISTSIFSTDWVQKWAESDWEHFHQHFQYRLSTEKSWEWPRTFPPASSVQTEYRKELGLGVTENISTSIFSIDLVQKRAETESDREHFHQHLQYRLSKEKRWDWEWPRTFPPASSVST